MEVSTHHPTDHTLAQAVLERRGFFPKGGGALRVSVEALPPGCSLPAFDLTERGEVSYYEWVIMIRSFWNN